VTSPDDERDRIRDLDDVTSTPVADRPDEVPLNAATGVLASEDGTVDPDRSGVGNIPTASPPSHSMAGTAEELPVVQGVFAPEGDEPAT
jgi:hypothetical protein